MAVGLDAYTKLLAAWTLFCVMLLSGFLRLYLVGIPQMTNDEAFAWRIAVKPPAKLLAAAAGDTAPPAHYLALKGWMKVFGTTPVALRALSVFCGVLLIVAVYALALETARWNNTPVGAAQFGGLIAAALAAIHSFQLAPNRTARMYGLGALLAVLSAWLLLRALRCRPHTPCAEESAAIAEGADGFCLLQQRYRWWLAYGVCAALFLLTHHFALFTLAAQGAFALCCAFAPRWPLTTHFAPLTPQPSPITADTAVAQRVPLTADTAVTQRAVAAQRAATFRGILLALAVALVIYSPWLPAGIAQTSRVSEDFWIEPRSLNDWGQAFVRWCVGIDWADATLITLCIAGTAVVVARTLSVRHRSHLAPRDETSPRGASGLPGDASSPESRELPNDVSSRGARGLHSAAVALLAQAALPWIAIVLISTVGDRPMLQDRYLAFSQASWLALLGVVVASISRPEWRAGVATLLFGATLLGTEQFIAALPAGPPGIVAASERLARDYRPGGVVLVQQAPDVNCLKYQLSQHGAAEVDVRAAMRPWPSSGHINHVASLESHEFLSRIEDLPADVPQLWFAGRPDRFPGGGNLPGWQWLEEITYQGHGPQAPDYILRRYERTK
jgi:hypothetical protein